MNRFTFTDNLNKIDVSNLKNCAVLTIFCLNLLFLHVHFGFWIYKGTKHLVTSLIFLKILEFGILL